MKRKLWKNCILLLLFYSYQILAKVKLLQQTAKEFDLAYILGNTLV